MNLGVNGCYAVWGGNSVQLCRWVIGNVVGHLLCFKDGPFSLTEEKKGERCCG